MMVVRLVALAQFVQGGAESLRQLLCRPLAPVVEEYYYRPGTGHVVMDRHHVQPMGPQRFEDRSYFLLQHSDITGDGRLRVRSYKSCPRIQSHAGVNCCAHLLDLQIIPSDGE